MKNAILGFLFFTSIVFPSFSHAQFVPFGGYDMEIFPECDCTPIPILLTCTNPAPTPPTYFFHLFAPLWIGTAVPIGGFLAQLIEEPALAFPDHVLLPGTWALGELIPVVPNPLTTCGVYISFLQQHMRLANTIPKHQLVCAYQSYLQLVLSHRLLAQV